MSELWALRLEKPTFHSMLDSSGVTLLDFDNVVRSLDKAALYASDAIVRSGKVFAGSPGYSSIEARLAGTAKILQHSAGFVPMTGPLARQFDALSKLFESQTSRISEVASGPVKGKAFGFVTNAATGIMAQVSGMKISLKLLKIVAIKQMWEYMRKAAKEAANTAKAKAIEQLKKAAAQAKGFRPSVKPTAQQTARFAVTPTKKTAVLGALVSLGDVFVTTVAENVDEIERSFLDNVRVMCDGAAQITGKDNAFGQSVKHSCQLFPDLLSAMLTFLTVLFADYGVMNCVCAEVAEKVRVEVIAEQCLKELTPSHWRVWMLQQVETRADTSVAVCHASMDITNNRLLTAFDPVSSRLYKLVEALSGLFNYLVVAVGLDTGDCLDYSSPYVVSIMPEPANYFMPCINTPDCRIRCLDVFNAFEEALQATVQEPVFVSRLDVNVESKYFSLDDIENQRHLPPFEIIGIAELYPAACRTVCGSFSAADRCLAIVGTEIDRSTLGIAYYCIPADMSRYVFRYAGDNAPHFSNVTWGASEVIEEAFLGSLHRLPSGGQDNMLVLTHDRVSDAKRIHLYTSEGIAVVLLQSAVYALETYNYVTDMGNDAFVMNSVDQVRVMPSTEVNSQCEVYIMGQKVYYELVRTVSGVRQPSQRIARVCMHKTITLSDSNVERPLLTVTEDCTEHIDSIFADTHLPVCLNEGCTNLLSVPTVLKSRDQQSSRRCFCHCKIDIIRQYVVISLCCSIKASVFS